MAANTYAPVHTSPPPPWAEGATPPPFVWDELDALYAHLYGLARDELACILDTFPIVRRKDEERYGEPGVSQSNPIGRSG